MHISATINIPNVPDYSKVLDHKEANSDINSPVDDEEFYIDPGHCEANICACFKEKCYVIKKSDIRLE